MIENIKNLTEVLDLVDNPVVITNSDNRIEFVNDAFTDLTGFTNDDMLGQNPNVLSSGQHDQQFYQDLWTTLDQDGRWQGRIINRKKDGEIFARQLVISAIGGEQSEGARYVAVYPLRGEELEGVEQKGLASLTNLPSRDFFFDRLSQALARARRDKLSTVLLVLNIDRFKQVNTLLGYEAGDVILSQVAERITGCVRDTDTVARLGGDEFAVILVGMRDELTIRKIVDKVQKALAIPFTYDGTEVRLSISIGVSAFPTSAFSEELTKELSNVEESLLSHADSALEEAKKQGQGSVEYHCKEVSDLVTNRVKIESDLYKALENDELMLNYQPIIDLLTENVVGAEALLRWQHIDRGWIPPAEFIPIAEDTDLILSIGDWTIRKALMDLKVWQDIGLPPLRVSVNLSPSQCVKGDCAKSVQEIVEEHKALANTLRLEITEGLMMENTQMVHEKLEGIKKLGVSMAIDDFGTGYSSLSYLTRMPVDTIKIDKAFIDNMENNSADAVLVDAITSMAHKLNFKVVAEGAETASQVSFLSQVGCDFVQGYFYSKPLPSDEFVEFCRRQNGDDKIRCEQISYHI
ncbi:EAL domain-containing protein [Magnetovibrio sp. PR-2]|uniref:putative bifunctional diguanylate cyclase/phosphodiesterase n=1 Tax=Magnetovibrio sp. PR-2 TaxID=3120356 RepID=UPI002FCDF1A9